MSLEQQAAATSSRELSQSLSLGIVPERTSVYRR
jgi:hypothetical protein